MPLPPFAISIACSRITEKIMQASCTSSYILTFVYVFTKTKTGCFFLVPCPNQLISSSFCFRFSPPFFHSVFFGFVRFVFFRFFSEFSVFAPVLFRCSQFFHCCFPLPLLCGPAALDFQAVPGNHPGGRRQQVHYRCHHIVN